MTIKRFSKEFCHHYKRFSKEFCTQKMKPNKTMRGQAISNHRKRKYKDLGSSIDSAAHNQTLKQQKLLSGRNHHIPISIDNECQQTQLPHQKTPFGKLD
jgi:flavodoxin